MKRVALQDQLPVMASTSAEQGNVRWISLFLFILHIGAKAFRIHLNFSNVRQFYHCLRYIFFIFFSFFL